MANYVCMYLAWHPKPGFSSNKSRYYLLNLPTSRVIKQMKLQQQNFIEKPLIIQIKLTTTIQQ